MLPGKRFQTGNVFEQHQCVVIELIAGLSVSRFVNHDLDQHIDLVIGQIDSQCFREFHASTIHPPRLGGQR